MAAEQLQIQVQANVQQAITGLNNLNTQLTLTGNAANELGATSLNILNNQLLRLQRIASNPNLSSEQYQRLAGLINKTSKEANDLAKSLNVLNGANGNLVKGANTANISMINLGRTVSDAPFGFIGIANNIGPLVENFVQLKKESGSTGSALKLLGGSLAGPGGLIVGVQLVVAAIQFAQLGFSRWGASAKKAKEDQDKLKEGQQQLIETTSKTRLEFETLVKIAKDATQTELARNQALKKLNEILPDTIGKLNQQNIATAQGSEIIRNYIKAVEAKATAELLANRIAENNVKLFDNRNAALAAVAEGETKLNNLKKKQNELYAAGKFEAAETLSVSIKNLENLSKQNTKQSEYFKTAKKILAENDALRKQYESLIPTVNTLNDKVEKTGKKTKEIPDFLKEYKQTLTELSYEEQIKGINKSNERLETNLDFLLRVRKALGENSAVYKTIAKDTQAFAIAASNQKIAEIITNYKNAIQEINLRNAITGQESLNAKISQTVDALIKLKSATGDNAAAIKLLQEEYNKLAQQAALIEIRKRTEEVTKVWNKFQSQVNKLNFNQTKDNLDILKSRIDLIGNTIQDLKGKGLTDKDLGIQILNLQFEQLGLQFAKLKEQQEFIKNLENIISGGLTNAVDGLIDAFAKGEDPFEALKNSVKGLIVELTKAVIKSLILKAVTSAIAGPAGGAAAQGVGGFLLRGDLLRNVTIGR